MFYFMNFITMLFLISMLIYSINYKNIMMTLISLEFMFINTIYMFYLILKLIKIDLYFMIFLLTLMICESVLGLTLLTYMIRNMGNDYLNSLNLLKW